MDPAEFPTISKRVRFIADLSFRAGSDYAIFPQLRNDSKYHVHVHNTAFFDFSYSIIILVRSELITAQGQYLQAQISLSTPMEI